jgi:ElaB/YqjD/DUF883 family membrane-anchored ribosome-binding protein
MDEQNKGLNEQWGQPNRTPERGYAGGDTADRRTSEIRSEIQQTRGEMQETIDAIEDRLKPRNVVSRAAGSVRDATVGRVKQAAATAQDTLSSRTRGWSEHRGNGFMDRIRENPVPAAIAATSLAWLAFSGRGRDAHMRDAIYGSTRDGDARLWETQISTDMEGVGTTYDDDLESSRGSIKERAGRAVERAQSVTSDAGSRLRDVSSRAQDGARRLTHENTMAAGAIAAAIGVAIGLALPETRREQELMGEARDSVVGKAKDAARGVAQRVQSAAEQVGKVAGEAVSGIDEPQR